MCACRRVSVERNADPEESAAGLTVAGSDRAAHSTGMTAPGMNSPGVTSTGMTSAAMTPNARVAEDELNPSGRLGSTTPRLTAVEDLPSSDPDTDTDTDPHTHTHTHTHTDTDTDTEGPGQGGVTDDEIDDASRRGTADAWDLVRRTQEGDAEAFGLLYDRYVDTIYRFVYYRLGDRTQAEDLTSETFLRALRRISTVHEQGRDIGAWLMTIARNLVLDHVKSAQYRLCVPTEEIVEAHLEQAGDTTEAAVLAGIDQRALLEAVRLLSPEQQESIVLRFFQGLSLAETAEVMGRNAGAVKALQHRAMQRLHVLLSPPPPKPPTNVADEAVRRELPRRHSPRAPPVSEDPTSTRRRYRTRGRRNH